MIRLVIFGARGRMGQRLIALAQNDARYELTAAIARDDVIEPGLQRAGAIDVIVDFSSDSGTKRAISLATECRAALLVGTTALADETRRALREAASSIPVMEAPNTSLGIAVLNTLLHSAAKILAKNFWALSMIDVHHDQKRDAPSGTARRLVETLNDAGRSDFTPEDVLCIRAGDVIGEHTVEFFGSGERIQLRHAATDRNVFAHGALHAAHWLQQQSPGRYVIEDALGLPAPAARESKA
ncbi:MAG: 4-hydroxy-tetrahydrodipicolinate reductase [Phycisphaerales bacterium]|nr:MAG: 4-hydroxy-tetrahydrodipicolinate reductase [Phycisphaerales bacterium]